MTIDDLKNSLTYWRFTKERLINLTIGFSAVLIYEFVARRKLFDICNVERRC
jgi:hypothetical protein